MLEICDLVWIEGVNWTWTARYSSTLRAWFDLAQTLKPAHAWFRPSVRPSLLQNRPSHGRFSLSLGTSWSPAARRAQPPSGRRSQSQQSLSLGTSWTLFRSLTLSLKLSLSIVVSRVTGAASVATWPATPPSLSPSLSLSLALVVDGLGQRSPLRNEDEREMGLWPPLFCFFVACPIN